MKNEFTESYAPPCAYDRFGNLHADGKDASNYHEELLNYIKTGLDNERAFIRSCRAYKKAEHSMAVLYGDTRRKELKGFSNVTVNKSRRQMREAIANQSDIRQNWQIRTTKVDDPLCLDQAEDLNNLSKDWWGRLFVDRVIRGALQYAAGHGTGYVFLWPDKNPITGEIDIIPHYLDYKSVLVGHIPADNNMQLADRVDIRVEMPLPAAHKKFPDHVGIIKPDTDIPSRMARNFEKTKKVYRGLWDWKKKKGAAQTAVSNPFPTVNIFYSFIDDQTINETGKTICMGETGSHWYYEVPSYYDSEGNVNKVKTGVLENGTAIERYLSREDCKLYPCRRLIISCSGGILYDGPPQWGDGTIPAVGFYFDRVAGEFLGFPVCMDSLPIETSVNNIFQAMEDSVIGKLNPPIGVDSSLPPTIVSKIQALGSRGLIGKVFHYSVAHLSKAIVSLMPPEHYTIGSDVFKLVEVMQNLQDYESGTQDWAGMAQLKQLPGEETLESLLRKLGVLTTDQAREQEKSFMMLGRIWLSFADQIYTVKRRLQILGTNALKPSYIDYDPTKFAQIYKDDPRPKWIIRREHMKNFAVYVSPNSVQEKQSIQNKLTLLQLQKAGGTIPDRMIYDAFIGDDQYEKRRKQYFEEQEEKAKAAARIQAEVAKIMQTLNPQQQQQPPPNNLMEQMVAALSASANQNQGVGRPPTNANPARLEQKTREGVPDVTLATN